MEQVPHRVRGGRRTGREQQPYIGEDLLVVEAVSISVGKDQTGNDVIAWLPTALPENRHQVGGYLPGTLPRISLVATELQEAPRPLAKLLLAIEGYAEHATDHQEGITVGEIACQIAATVGHCIDQPVCELRQSLDLHPLDRCGAKRRRGEAPVHAVRLVFHGLERHSDHRFEGEAIGIGGRETLVVAKGFSQLRVPADHESRQARKPGRADRMLFAQAAQGLVQMRPGHLLRCKIDAGQ